MTAFEIWIEENGGRLVDGQKGDFSTYTNVQRTWVYGIMNLPIQIGLVRYKDSNSIMLRSPMISHLPTEDYDNFINNWLMQYFPPSTFKGSDQPQLIIKNE
jgi:hypothetical protein